MDIGYIGIGLVLVIGIAIVVYGWLGDRAATRRRQEALTSAPDRTIPGLSADAPIPAYLTEDEALRRGDYHPTTEMSEAERAALREKLPTLPSLPFGHLAREFATDEPSELCVLADPWILVTKHDVTTLREILPFMEKARAEDRRVVVIAPLLDREVVATLQVNAVQHTLSCAAVQIKDADQLRTLCSLVGAVPIPWEDLRAGYVPSASLGTCKTWISSPSKLWIAPVDG